MAEEASLLSLAVISEAAEPDFNLLRKVFVPDPSLTDLCHFPSRFLGESSMLSVERDSTERLVKLEIEAFVSDFLFESLDVFEFVLECNEDSPKA